MLYIEQEALYKKVRKLCPAWTPIFCSGYVHGCQDENTHTNPLSGTVRAARIRDQYARGYLTGFARRRGADAEVENWYSIIEALLCEVPRGL